MTTTVILAFFITLLLEAVSQFTFYDYMLEEQSLPENCVCVPYWQCKEDNSGLVEDGVDIIDMRIIRQAEIPCAGDFDVCCEVKCGRKNNGMDSRIFNRAPLTNTRILGNNNEADFGEFPWMLGILQDRVFRCGGSLIHPQMAMTAAHCVSILETYIVRAGEYNWETKQEPLPHQDRYSKKVIIHPLFDLATLRNDIALLLLDKPFKLSQNVGIVCIPPRQMRISSEKCIVTGWGKNSSKAGTYQSILKKILLLVIPRRQCTEQLNRETLGPFFRLDKSFICAGEGFTKDACKGDGGGPLICPISDEPDRYQQVGIVSWGLTCGTHSAPGLYVNMAMFSDWIDRQMIYYNFDTRIYRTSYK